MRLSGTAEWYAGSLHTSGTAELQANVDGSASIQLNLSQASRTETQTQADLSRTCQWIDSAGTSHEVLGPNCFLSIPWFAPGLFAQPTSQLPPLIGSADDGEISKNGSSFHQISYVLNVEGTNSGDTKKLIEQSRVKVLYDLQSFLPASLEYSIHPDNDTSQSLDVRVVFSDYRSISGVMVPFHIEKYVQRSLQLKLDISTASIE